MPCDFYASVSSISSVLPLCSKGPARQVGLVIDPTRSPMILVALAPFAAFLRCRGWTIHLVGLGRGALSWPGVSHELFASIVPFPLSLATTPPTTTSRDAYLGTPIPRLTGSDWDAAVGTLAGFDLVVSVENTFAHRLMGQLRDMKVETWALIGMIDAIGQSVEIVNACAAFEHAYQKIVVLNAKILRLCCALGFPAEKLRRWGEDEVGSNDDWSGCLPISLPANVVSNPSAFDRR